jgi:hypothetical protein
LSSQSSTQNEPIKASSELKESIIKYININEALIDIQKKHRNMLKTLKEKKQIYEKNIFAFMNEIEKSELEYENNHIVKKTTHVKEQIKEQYIIDSINEHFGDTNMDKQISETIIKLINLKRKTKSVDKLIVKK